MSINSVKILCSGCDYRADDYFRPIRIRYSTSTGRTVETGRARGWCFNCRTFSYIEDLDCEQLQRDLALKNRTLDETKQRLEETGQHMLSRIRYHAERRRLRSYQKQLGRDTREICDLIDVLMRRQSGARCLYCWSTSTTPLKFDPDDNIAQGFRHDCGGIPRIVEDWTPVRIHYAVVTYLLSEEGELLGEDYE